MKAVVVVNVCMRWFGTAVALSSVLLAGCGGGGSSSTLDNPVLTGIFLDGPVDGVEYFSSTQSGITENGGKFHYLDGETVTFHIGDVLLGEATAREIVTPVDLVPGATDALHRGVTNMVRLLVTLDSDGDPSNGIHIRQQARDAAKERDIPFDVPYPTFEMDKDMNHLVSQMTNTSLVDIETAQAHLQETLMGLDIMMNR